MLRPQRLDKLLYVPLPDANARLQILTTLSRNTVMEEQVTHYFFIQQDINILFR